MPQEAEQNPEQEPEIPGSETMNEPEMPGPAGTGLLGGWKVYNDENTEYKLPDNAKGAFDKALQSYVGMNFKPVALLGTQVVAGTNYQILCIGSPVVPDPVENLYVVQIYEDLSGNSSITNVAEFDFAQLEENRESQIPDSGLLGGWAAPEEIDAVELPENVQNLFDETAGKLMGVRYIPAAILGTKIIAGTEYALLAHAQLVTADPVNYYAVLFLAQNADGSSELLNIAPLNCADYNN